MSFTKYYKYKEKVSYDGGQHWEYTGREAASGSPIGTYDTMDECVGIKYRWVKTESTVCVNQEGGGDYITFQLMERHGDPDLRYNASYRAGYVGNVNTPFEYSVDSGRTWYTGTNNVNLLSGLSFNVGDIIMFRQDLRPYYEYRAQDSNVTSISPGHFKVLNGYWKVFGHISSLVFGTDKHLYNTVIGNKIHYGLFGITYDRDADASNGIYDASELELVSASIYPMNLSGMYSGMFSNNKSLRTAPELPAVLKPGAYCYRNMFAGCINLTQPPSSIPVAVLESACFAYMFKGCNSLTTAPQLPSKFNVRDSRITLSSFAGLMVIYNGGWFDEMFAGCAALRSFPQTIRLEENGKTEVVQGDTYYAGGIGLYSMFSGCTSLSGSISYRIDNYYIRSTDAYEYPADKMLEQCGGVTSVNLSIGRLVEYGQGATYDAFGFKYIVRNTPSSGTLNLSFPSEAYTIMDGCDSPSCGIVPSGWIVNKT